LLDHICARIIHEIIFGLDPCSRSIDIRHTDFINIAIKPVIITQVMNPTTDCEVIIIIIKDLAWRGISKLLRTLNIHPNKIVIVNYYGNMVPCIGLKIVTGICKVKGSTIIG
jgi:hypothetical protein